MAGAPRPEALDARDLQLAAAALGVALDVSQCARLVQFAALLARWNRVHNLTAIERPGQMLTHHLLDSLAVAPTLAARASALRVLDVGSGGGLPGVPLAIARPQDQYTLLDKVAKKVAFVTQARAELGLGNVVPVHARVEDYRAPRYDVAPFDVIVSRAFAALADFVRVTRHLLAPGGCWCAMKGTLPAQELQELAAAGAAVRVVGTVKLRVPRLDAERHLVLLEPT
jgi:16S rRNA (guanine527-N7)-methyltransferase